MICTALTGALAATAAHAQTAHAPPLAGFGPLTTRSGPAIVSAPMGAGAIVLPKSGDVAAGSATIGAAHGGTLAIRQRSDRAIIDWNAFSIGAGGAVWFDNGDGATLNRVTGGDLSAIDGLLNATGSVYLLNPNGIIIGKQGVVDVGGSFVGSTLDLSDAAFLRGGDLTLGGPSSAAVVNLGHIGALGGDVVLAAHIVTNRGEITSGNGAVALLASRAVLLSDRDSGDGRFGVVVRDGGTSATNAGAIVAATAALRANGGSIYALAGNTRGIIDARGVAGEGGRVFLTAGAGGTIDVADTDIAAAGPGAAIHIGSADTGNTTIGDGVTIATGAGGFIETSARRLAVGAGRIDAGAGGTWLLDPVDVTIDAAMATTIENALDTIGIRVVLTNGAGADQGNITVAAPIAWSGDGHLSLDAVNNLTVDAPITATGASAGLVLAYGGAFDLNAPITLSGASATLAINGDTHTLIHDATQLQAMQGDLSGHYALGNDIDASATAGWNAGAGFAPVGDDGARFTGTLNGLGHVVSDLTIDRPAQDNVGLFGFVGSGGTIRDIGLIGGTVNGYWNVGGLIGFNYGAVTNAYAAGTVSGQDDVGGLIAVNFGAVTNAYAAGTVKGRSQVGGLIGGNLGAVTDAYAAGTVNGRYQVGGLIGGNYGAVTDAYAAGTASGQDYVGGLTGSNDGAVTDAYAAETVKGRWHIGGLIGFNTDYGAVTNAYAAGAVSGQSYVGGLIGTNRGSAVDSYWDTKASGQATSDGGIGLTTAEMQDPFTFIDAGWDFTSVWSKSKSDANGGYMMLRAFGGDLYGRFIRISGDTARTYGDADPDIAGVTIDGPGAAGVTPGWGSAITARTGVGAYAYGAPNVLALAFGAGSASDYYVDFDGTLTINPRHVTVRATDGTSTYGDDPLGFGLSASNLAGFDTVSALTGLSNDFLITRETDAGSYTMQVAGTLTNPNYIVDSMSAGTWVVDPAALTITASDRTKTYGDALDLGTSAFIANGLVNGDTVSGVTLASSGADARANAGDYAIAASAASGTGLANYDITYADGNLTVAPRHITVTTQGGFSTYGDNPANPGLSATNLASFDTVSALTGLSNAFPITGTTNIGDYTPNVAGRLTNPNYVVDSRRAGRWIVATRPIIILADYLTRIYGDSNPALTYTIVGSGLVNGDTLTGTLETTADLTSGVGDYAITQGSLAASSNYSLGVIPGTLTIDPRHVTVTALGGASIYGDNPTDPGLSATNLAGFDTVAALTGLSNSFGIAPITGTGDHALNVVGTLGNANYVIDQRIAGNWRVAARPITINADDLIRIYGDANPALTYAIGGMGLVNGDTLTGALATSAGMTANVGSYAITQGDLTASANYELTFDPGTLTVDPRQINVTALGGFSTYGDIPTNPGLSASNLAAFDTVAVLTGLSNDFPITGMTGAGYYTLSVAGTLTNPNYVLDTRNTGIWSVAARPITITANDFTRIYGRANPALTYAVGGMGLVNGDTLAGALAAADATANVGDYAISIGSLAASADYALSFVPGMLTVTPAALTITANDRAKTYGDALDLGMSAFTTRGLVNGDTISAVTLTSAGADARANAGGYAIAASAATGTGLTNYAISYADGLLTVDPRHVVVTALGGGSTYGESGNNPGLSATNLAGFDTVAALTGLSNSFGITAQTHAGTHALGVEGVLANPDYIVDQRIDGLWTVAARPITVAADDLARIYGDANPASTYAVGGMGLANGDTLTGALATTAGLTSNVGDYAIAQGSLAASADYALSFTPGTLTIDPRHIAVTALGGSSVYGEASVDPGLAATNLADFDDISALTGLTNSFGIDGTSHAGDYTLEVTGALGNANYVVDRRIAGLWSVTARPITATAADVRRAYGDANPAPAYAIGGMGLVNGDALTGAPETDADARSTVGDYAITQGSLAASADYALSFTPGTLTIDPRHVIVTALGGSSIYGDAAAGPGLSASNLAGFDTVAALTGLSNSFGITGTTDAGDYALDVAGTLTNPNYVVDTRVSGLWTVAPRPITVAADDVSRIYGDANPALTYTIGGMGLVNGDTLTGAPATDTDARSTIGDYSIGQGSLAASANYALSFDPGTLTITPRPLAIAADDQNKRWGTNDPPLTWTVGGLGLVNGDTLAGALARAPGETPGIYTIGQGNLGASADYAVSFTPGALTIAPVLIETGIPLEDASASPPAVSPAPPPPPKPCVKGDPCLIPYPANLDAGSAIRFAAVR